MSTEEPTPESETSMLTSIVGEEENCLRRILDHVEAAKSATETKKRIDYDSQLLELRDEIAASRMEDVPPLLEQMERLQGIAARQRELTTGFVDPASPYFGRMVLHENGRSREVLIGRSTYLDSKAGVRIVDWRDAPVSRLFYRYSEGDEYEENFGGRDLEGQVQIRRSVTIVDGRLRRIVAPQGTFLRPEKGDWRTGGSSVRLAGGQGSAIRADQHHRPRTLGVGETFDASEDKHLKEITALIDPRQFELITKPDSGLIVIQGGAGSGKTTIGLHRLAYLAFQDRRRFRPDKMLVVVFNHALARYIAQVLPALDVGGVAVRTYEDWALQLRRGMIPRLPRVHCKETPPVVTRLKKHPAMLTVIESYVQSLAAAFEERIAQVTRDDEALQQAATSAFRATRARPLVHRFHGFKRWVENSGNRLALGTKHSLEREVQRAVERASNLVHAWVDILTQRSAIASALEQRSERTLSDRELSRALEWCHKRCTQILQDLDDREEAKAERSDEEAPNTGAVDGEALEERATLDVEDETLLLLLWQKIRGPVRKSGSRDPLVYEHILVDEAQDLSPVELAVVMGCISGARSITLAGDVAQRLHMDNGFSGWSGTLGELGLSHVEVEPLKLSYRSTAEIVEFSRDVLAHLADEHAPEATRSGAPVELFRFADLGDAVGFLADALRDLVLAEPRASIAVIARHPEQADLVYLGLEKAETPRIRRIAEQDFSFTPGVDVTDIRQVKGLEFDYVVLIEVTESTYPSEDEARHLLHIGATRAAHQLWLLCSGKPAAILPQALRDRSF